MFSKESNAFFEADEDASTNAFYGDLWGLEAYHLMDGYARGALSLIDIAVEENERDTLLYPILFLFRHYVEIAIKETYIKIMEYNKQEVDRTKIKNHHLDRAELMSISKFLKEKWNQEIPSDIVQVIKNLHKIDNSGQVFKYLYDIKGNKIRDKNYELIGYENLKQKIQKVYSFFDNIYSYLDNIIEERAEYEAEMRRYADEF